MKKIVIKRDGTKEGWDIEKIRRQIIPACAGTSINPLEFESLLALDISHNIKSEDIQEKLKLIAKNRIPIEKMIKNKCYRKNSLFGKYINN